MDGSLITGKIISGIFIYLITWTVIQSGESDRQSLCRWWKKTEELPSPMRQWHSIAFHNPTVSGHCTAGELFIEYDLLPTRIHSCCNFGELPPQIAKTQMR